MFILGCFCIMAALASMMMALGFFSPAMGSRLSGRRFGSSRTVSTSAFVDSDPRALGPWRFFTVPALLERAKRNIVLGGYQAGWGLRRLLVIKVVLGTVVGFASFTFFGLSPSVGRFAAFAALTGLAFFYPDIWLDARSKERQKRIERELPDVLDQTVIALESGLSFEAAISRIAENSTGPLSEEFRRTLQDMRLGMSRRMAYKALSARTTVEDVQRFCKQIIQAEEFGVSMSTVVRNRASDMRIKRRHKAEEIAQKIPVKIIAPLAACFLPVLFIVILYPAFHGMTF